MRNKENWNGHHGRLLNEKVSFKVIECELCGFNHIIPIPTEEELDLVYKEQYYCTEKPLYIERMKEDSEWWKISYSDRYDSFEEALGKKGRILDVGSGTGYFLKFGVERGWEALGVEPSRQAAEFSKNELKLNILEEFLSEKNYGSIGTFDVIHLSMVLEHIPNPIGLLKLLYKILKPGGIICVVVPNDYNPFQNTLVKLDNYDPWWVAPPHHINYFSFDSLSSLLKKIGYEIILKETTFPIDIFLLMGDKYIGDDTLGRSCHKKRMRMEQLLYKAGYNKIKREMYQSFARLGIGREVIILAKKP